MGLGPGALSGRKDVSESVCGAKIEMEAARIGGGSADLTSSCAALLLVVFVIVLVVVHGEGEQVALPGMSMITMSRDVF